ncbi:MAG: ABC transporter permease [Myxococcales bacterium]|nr:ABC transporter permease [Myxococcales bacterium]
MAADHLYEWTLASRILRSRRSAHLSLVTAMSTGGIALGVGALIVVLAVNTGFQAAFQDRILATWPHLVVMRRGVDLRDWQDVTQRLSQVPGVRSVVPATYDDMMLAGPLGRAGAIVRGIPAAALGALPEGSVIAGALDLHGEGPRTRWQGDTLHIDAATAGARHVLVVGHGGGPWLHTVAVLPPPAGLAGLVVFDPTGCDAGDGARPDGEVWLVHPDTGDVVRRAPRTRCAQLAAWEVAPGHWTLRWRGVAGVQRDQALDLDEGGAAVVAIDADQARLAPPPPADLPAQAAGVCVVGMGGRGLRVYGPGTGVLPATPAPQWHALPAALPAIALGEGLAKRLQVRIGDEVRAVSPLRGIDRGTEASPGSAAGRFRVRTIVRTGFHDHDQRLAIVDFRAAQRFLGRGDLARWVEVRIDDPILAKARIPRLQAALEPTTLHDLLTGSNGLRERFATIARQPETGVELRPPRDAVATVDNWVSALRAARQLRIRTGGAWRVVDWEEMNKNIFDAARMQKVAMSLFPFIIVLVAALNVVGTQAVVVHERARDIAILRAMGATRRSVALIFLLQGLAVGVSGTFLGLLAGGVATVLLDAVGYPLDPQVYLISRLPVLIEPATFWLAGSAAIVLSFGAAWLAAQRAASRPPVEALRRLD